MKARKGGMKAARRGGTTFALGKTDATDPKRFYGKKPLNSGKPSPKMGGHSTGEGC